MEHAPTIGALCGGRLAKAKGVRYGPPTDVSGRGHTLHLATRSSQIGCLRRALVIHVAVHLRSLASWLRSVQEEFVPPAQKMAGVTLFQMIRFNRTRN